MNIQYLNQQLTRVYLLILIVLLTIPGIAKTKVKNGFDLSGSLVPVGEILMGGPQKDGIPALNRPRYIPAKKAGFLNDKDRVLGVVIENKAKAYPVKILNWHEIVNDYTGDIPFVITYCPLCGSGMAFSSVVDQYPLTFGVSGLLYNSDVLLYDSMTQSLWSQIMQQSISGKFKGKKLKTFPIRNTTWKKWRENHPNTLVLSTKTGFKRNYKKNPYEGYEESEELYFPVNLYSHGIYHPKERVLGVDMNGVYKAYPFFELNLHGRSHFQDTINDQMVNVHWDKDSQSGRITDSNGEEIHITQVFWFAWSAFHPHTQVFKAKRED